MTRLRTEIGILCLRAASRLTGVPGLYRLGVLCVVLAVIVLPEEYRKGVAIKMQWETARQAREREERDEHRGSGRTGSGVDGRVA